MDLLTELLATSPPKDDLELDEIDLEWLQELQPPITFHDRPRLHRPQLHLICGDSIARDAPLAANILSVAEGGQTWQRLLDSASAYVQLWTSSAAERDMVIGNAAIWLTGNDVYPRRPSPNPLDGIQGRCEALRDVVVGAISLCHPHCGEHRGDPGATAPACGPGQALGTHSGLPP